MLKNSNDEIFTNLGDTLIKVVFSNIFKVIKCRIR